jgi:hypothetical protein
MVVATQNERVKGSQVMKRKIQVMKVDIQGFE